MDILKGELSKGTYFVFDSNYVPNGWSSEFVSYTFKGFIKKNDNGVLFFDKYPINKYVIINVIKDENDDLRYIPDVYPEDLLERNINLVGTCIVDRSTITTNDNTYCERKVGNNILMPLYTLLTYK